MPVSGLGGQAVAGERRHGLRFDDKLATVLAQPLQDAAGRAAAWRQIIDILAQHRAPHPMSDEALDLVRHLRDEVSVDVRQEAARAIAGRRLPPELVALMAEEPPSVAAPLIGSVRLAPGEWLDLLPRLSPTTRALLRHRRDLPSEVTHALKSFGASDFVIPASPEAMAAFVAAPEPPVEQALSAGETQIRDLLARINAFREKAAQRRADPEASAEPEAPPAPPAAIDPSAPAGEFRFETGPDGIVIWVEGAPRGPLIGATIAAAAAHFDHGVDGHAAGAFRRRAPFRDARLTVAGAGPAAGEWRISAVPFFDLRDGHFTGYRGTARRPRPDESAAPIAESGLYGSGIPSDSLRQLVHELRTPLNAIVGFAEMIERQMLGPAAHAYRTRASDIVLQGRRLLAAVDDLDVAARIDTHPQVQPQQAAPVDAASLLTRLHAEYEPLAMEREVALRFRIAPDLPAVDADAVVVERMYARLLAATIGLATGGDVITVTLDRDDGAISLAVGRPSLLAGRDERALLDPGYSPEGDWPDAPVLGLGFALRLVRNLAIGARGSLDIGEDRFILRLPARTEAMLSGNG